MAARVTKDSILNGWKAELATAAETALKPLADAVREAKRDIAQAASDAKSVVSAQAANEASRVVSSQAANEASRVSDHDLLVTLNTELRLFTQEVKGWKEETGKRIEQLEKEKLDKTANEKTHTDLELRTRNNETSITRIQTWGAALVFLVGVLEVIATILVTKFWL